MKPLFKDFIPIGISFFVPFLIYLFTLSPTVSFTDSGELALACTSLGVAHPTGYPIFVILGYLWSILPLPFSSIYKLNLFACFCTALSVALFYKIVFYLLRTILQRDATPSNVSIGRENKHAKKKKEKKPLIIHLLNDQHLQVISLAVSLMYAFSRTIWAQATSIEVYSLHLVFLNFSIFLFLRALYSEANRIQDFLMWAFVLGLGFCNHLTMILLAPAMIYSYFNRFGFKREAFVRLSFITIPFLIGLSVYLYLPLRSAMTPELNWGEVHRSFEKFFYHVSGRQYQINLFNGVWQPQAKLYFALLPFELALIGFVPLAIGAAKMYKDHSPLFWFITLLITSSAIYGFNYNVHDADAYFLLSFLALILFVAFGVMGLMQINTNLLPLVFLLPMIALLINFQHNNQRDNTLVRDYTTAMVEPLEQNALILSAQWDYFCSAFWYLQFVEGYRGDVVMIEKELLRRTWYIRYFQKRYPDIAEKIKTEIENFIEDLELFESGKPYNQARIQLRWVALLNALLTQNMTDRPIYITTDVLQTEPEVATLYKKIPQGFALRLSEVDSIHFHSSMNIESFLTFSPRTHLEEGIMQTAATQLSNNARFARSIGIIQESERLSLLSAKIRRQIELAK